MRDDNLDVGWLPESTALEPDVPRSLRETADLLLGHLRIALAAVESLIDELPGDDGAKEDG